MKKKRRKKEKREKIKKDRKKERKKERKEGKKKKSRKERKKEGESNVGGKRVGGMIKGADFRHDIHLWRPPPTEQKEFPQLKAEIPANQLSSELYRAQSVAR